MILEPGLALYIVFTLQNSFTGIGREDKIPPFHEGPRGTAGVQCLFIPHKQYSTEDSF